MPLYFDSFNSIERAEAFVQMVTERFPFLRVHAFTSEKAAWKQYEPFPMTTLIPPIVCVERPMNCTNPKYKYKDDTDNMWVGFAIEDYIVDLVKNPHPDETPLGGVFVGT